MKYKPTLAGNAPYLVENNRAYFSIRVDDGKYYHGQYLNIITTEEDYVLDGGKNADLMIKMKVTLTE